MEILWLVIGAAIGLVAAWLFLEARYRTQLSSQEARLSETNRRIQRALERELGAHEATAQRLSRMDDEDATNKKRIAGLNADLDAIRQVLESVKTDAGEKGLAMARQQIQNEELMAQLDAARDEYAQLDAVVRRARGDSEAAAEGIRAQIATLESRLLTRDESPARPEDERKQVRTFPGETRADHDAAVEVYEARIADLESRLRDRENAIASLEAELAELRATAGGGEG